MKARLLVIVGSIAVLLACRGTRQGNNGPTLMTDYDTVTIYARDTETAYWLHYFLRSNAPELVDTAAKYRNAVITIPYPKADREKYKELLETIQNYPGVLAIQKK
ncbi:MAG: hypothetical protein QM594_00560 [Niabella sp.]